MIKKRNYSIEVAMDCENWPQWMHNIVDKVVEDSDHMSTEQAIAYGILLSPIFLEEYVDLGIACKKYNIDTRARLDDIIARLRKLEADSND